MNHTLKSLRIQRGWTQTRLARAAKLHPSTISLIENGRITGLPATLKRISQSLGCDPRELILEGTPPAEPNAPVERVSRRQAVGG